MIPSMALPPLDRMYCLPVPYSDLDVVIAHSTTGGDGGPTVRVSTLADLKSAVAGNGKTVILTGMSLRFRSFWEVQTLR